MNILLLTRYGQQGASSRMRFYQFLPNLESAKLACVISPLFDNEMLSQKYRQGKYGLLTVFVAYFRRIKAIQQLKRYDLVWIEKEALPWWPSWFERWLLRSIPYCLDFDDAIFHNYDLHQSSWIRHLYGKRIDRLMSGAKLVVAGNAYLAERAIAAGAERVEILPTVVDTRRYAVKTDYTPQDKFRIIWIGSPSTVRYLALIAQPLAELAQRHSFTFRIIGGTVALPGVDVEMYPWTLEGEACAIAECDVGIMPMFDSPWEQGKCAYKLIQYMACGLPTVSSPIGANLDVIINEETGLFAHSAEEWLEKLDILLSDVALRRRLGQSGRKRVEAEYSLHKVAPILIQLLKDASTERRCS